MHELKGNIDDIEIETAVKRAEKELKQYTQIMSLFPNTDVSKDISFQREYRSFYKFIFLDEDFICDYFSFFQEHKNSPPDFIETLKYFQEKYDKFFYSYVSKMLATIDPNLPVWDTNVYSVFGFKNPDDLLPKEKRINRAKVIYKTLEGCYKDFILSEEGCKWIKLFDEIYPDSNITAIKKINLILWKLGSNKKNDGKTKSADLFSNNQQTGNLQKRIPFLQFISGNNILCRYNQNSDNT